MTCKTNFACALQADTFLKLLGSVQSDEVEVGFTDRTVFFRSGKERTGVRAKLPYMGEEDFFFKWPAMKRLPTVELKKPAATKFFNGMELCLSSVGDQVPYQMGVTLNQNDKFLRMYSTNNKAMSKFSMSAFDVKGMENIILPTTFCKALLKASQVCGKDKVSICTAKDFVVFKFGDDCMLYGKLINNKDPLDFEKVIREQLPEKFKDKRQAMPDDFGAGIDRALLLLSHDLSKLVNITIDSKTVSVEAKSSLGQIKSGARFKKAWPSRFSFDLDAELAAKAVIQSKEVYFGRHSVIFSKGSYLHLISISGLE